jgi:hypothetical protein
MDCLPALQTSAALCSDKDHSSDPNEGELLINNRAAELTPGIAYYIRARGYCEDILSDKLRPPRAMPD